MKLFNRTRDSKKYFLSIIGIAAILLMSSHSYGQGLQIQGLGSVLRGSSYGYYPTYNGSGSYNYNGTYTWYITGGYITGTSGNTTKSGTINSALFSLAINVTWTTTSSSGSISLNLNIGNTTKTITVAGPLTAGTISPTSSTIFYGYTVAFTGTAATGGAGSPIYNYQWEKSTDAVNWTSISGATGVNYTTDTLQAARYFRRKVTETTTSTVAYTPTATVNVYPKLTCSIGNNQTINYNTAPESLISSVSGGTGSYSYVWQASSDSISWYNPFLAVFPSYNPGKLLGTMYFRLTAYSITVGARSNVVKITVHPQLNCSISSSQSINYNSAATPLSSSVTGGNGTYTYNWQSSPNNSSWTSVGSGNSFDPGVLAATTYYRLITASNGVNDTSNTATLTVYPQLTCSVVPASQVISPGTSPATMSASVSGGSGSYSYQWQSSPDNINWTNKATAATYNPGALVSNQFYRVIVTSNGANVTSNAATVNTSFSSSLSITSTTASGNGSISLLTCATSGGSGAYSYTWYASTDGGSGYQQISGATGATYTTDEVTVNTMYYVVATSGGNTSNSNTVSIVMPATPTIISNATTVCNGANVTFAASGGNGSYRWYNASGTLLGTGSTYSTAVSGTYHAVSYSTFGMSPHSNTITVTALTTPNASIIGSSVCVLGSSAQLANTNSGGSWSSSDENIAKIYSNGVVTGKQPGTATITYTATNVCGTGSSQLGITVVPFDDISLTLGNGIADPLITDTISLLQNTIRTTEFRQDTSYSTAHSIKNVLALKVVEESDKYIPGDFSATAVLKVEYGHSSADIYQLDSIKLQVNYTKGEGSKYNALNYFSFNNAEFTRVTVLRIEAPSTVNGESFDTKQVLLLTNALAGMRYYKLADNKKPLLSYSDPGISPVPDQLPVSWTLPEHTQNNGIQLEWAWLEDGMKDSYSVNGVFDTSLLFKTSASRIDLPGAATAGNYNIPLLYDGTGTLYIRARAISLMPTGTRSDGPWSGVSTYGFDGHNSNLNWQMTTTFAEEGKRKTVIQYYDGSLRQRQTVTKDNTTGQTVVAETMYDMQGRPAVQILPAPGITNIIAYTQNLNNFNGQSQVDANPADYFDFTTASLGNYGTEPLNENSGTAKYYSTQNPDANTGYHKNIPRANGYAYAVTRYTPDATGRIMRQSGAGDSLRMGSGHETKYFYGTPAQEELDALFGTEAGNYTHYFKNMVQDANGQMSISYTDMHGRTVATSLAGEAPASMQALNITDTAHYKNQAGKLLTRNLLNKNSNILKGRSIEAINSILVPFKTNHDFSYQLTKQTLTLPTCDGGTVTYDCKFDLQIAVTDESGDTEPVIYNYINIENINFNETLLLEAGSYSVRKTLTINQESLDNFIAQYNTVGVGLCKSQQQLIDSIYAADSTGCSVEPAALTSNTCITSLGGYPAYLSNYATSIGKTVGQLSAATLKDIRNQYVADSTFCVSLNANASSTLANIRKQMLADMVPYSGQYAKESGPGTMYSKYNIFVTGGTGRPFYRNPLAQPAVPGNYYNPFGDVDSSVLATRLLTMSKADFENEFKESWAVSLLPYHPEYAKLKFAEDSLQKAYNFIDSIQLVSAPFNLMNSDPYFTITSRAAEKDSMTRYGNVAWKDMNNYSMWQMAYADACGCKLMSEPASRTTCYNNMPKVQTTTGTSINTGAGTVTLTAAMQAQAWAIYRGLYGQARNEMVNRFINVRPGKVDTADNHDLSTQEFRIYFPYNYVQAAQNYKWETWYPKAGVDGSTASVNLADSTAKYSSGCESHINAWKQALLDCPELKAQSPSVQTTILNSITSKMLEICELGTNASNPNGASTVPPNYTWLEFTSFEQAIDFVLDSAGIDKSMLCNPYAIEWPKPYGKNRQVTKQYVASIDECTCSNWFYIGNEMNLAGYNKYSFASANQYLRTRYQDTLTLALFNGLNSCSNGYTYNCRDTVIYITDHVITPYYDTVEICDNLSAYPLQSPQILPAFLTCGFDSSNLKCFNCNDFISLDTAFYSMFGKHPVFAGEISDSAIAWNDLFARYVNFKTGLSHDWMYYADKFNTSGCAIGGISGSGAGLAICPEQRPLNDTTGFVQYAITPCQATYNRATDKAGLQYEYIRKQLIADFNTAYLNACLRATEAFTVADTIKEYHYTLYYYDQGSNLVKTVPPKGVRPDYSSTFLTAVATERAKMISAQSWAATVPQHSFITKYCYNSLNQVVVQKSPDAGVSRFWYDRLGRLAVSRNAKQKAGNEYSYTFYDSLGRITEVGQLTNNTAITDAIAKSESSLQTWFNDVTDSRIQITQTIYDIEYGCINGVVLSQKNLRNRVSYTQVVNNATDIYPASATYYTYDIHGNVDTLLQDFGNSSGVVNAMNQSCNRFKKIVYNYDLVSGKVNQVSYQPGQADAYYHRYEYDAENRLTDVYTGRDSIMLEFFAEREAHYNYYKHGPLAQTILGQLQVQKQEYMYTMQGWLKAVNPDSTITGVIAKNVYSFVLNYYNNDYKGIGVNSPTAPIPAKLGADNRPLFNGNISFMGVNVPKLGKSMLYNYQYDQLNRLVGMDAWASSNYVWGGLYKINAYNERISYDPNGNILTYNRHGNSARLSMDSLSYHYTANTNRLNKITDAATDASPGDYDKYNDIKQGQTDDNYQYDEIGNLVADNAEDVTNVTWNVYGKIASITKSGSLIKYVYDAGGNRIMKQTSSDTTVYLRDASGNVMSVYSKPMAGALVQSETHLYGSSRFGMAIQRSTQDTSVILSGGFKEGTKRIFVRGEKIFELSNHLGNVLATVSDKRLAVSIDGNTIDNYIAEVNSANDYYPFGMQQPARKFNAGSYRYGFNGKENDNEVKGEGVQQDYGMRIYDARLARFLSVDPISKSYPELTPFQFASNRPIDGIDLDGLEFSPAGDASASAWQYYNLDKIARNNGQDPVKYNKGIANQTAKGHLLTLVTAVDVLFTKGWLFRLFTGSQVAGAFEHNRAKTEEGRVRQNNSAKTLLTDAAFAWMGGKLLGVTIGTVGELTGIAARRFNFASQAYKSAGFTEEQILSHTKGIDLKERVFEQTYKKGQELEQWTYLDASGNPKLGNYYTLPGTDPNTLGIPLKDRVKTTVILQEDTKFLQSTASDIENWTNPGEMLKGGGTQLFQTNVKIEVKSPSPPTPATTQ